MAVLFGHFSSCGMAPPELVRGVDHSDCLPDNFCFCRRGYDCRRICWSSRDLPSLFGFAQIEGRTLASIFREAGCLEPASPSCAACLGGPADTYARMNEPFQCVSTTNRNFPGRMGHKVR